MPLFISKGGKKGHNNNKETSKAVILNKQKHCDLIFLFGVINAFKTLTRWRDQEISHSTYHLH